MQVKFHPWNPPGPLSRAQTLRLVTQDCYQHSRYADNYILLEDNQILMPRVGENLTQVILESNLAPGPNSIAVRRFCSEYPNDKKSSTLLRPISILQSTYFNKKLSEGLEQNLFHSGAGVSTSSLLSSALSVNEYGPCDKYDFNEQDHTAVYDPTALKFMKSITTLFNKIN